MSEEIKTEGEFKVKKPKKFTKPPETVKLDLSKKEENNVEEETIKVDLKENNEEVVEEINKEEVDEQNVISEVTEEEESEVVEQKEEIQQVTTEQKQLPENIEKLIAFMEETGGNIEDYVRINADYSGVDDNALLLKYYEATKPHLANDEINFIIEDSFSFDEEYDDEKQIRKKKLAKKEEIAKARNYLEGLKSKYYDEIKLRPSITNEQREATDFFNKYKQNQKKANDQHSFFKSKTKEFFNENFKGFDFNVGEKKFRYNVNNVEDTASQQSDLSGFVKKFLNEDGSVNDYSGYHKALYTARNADTIAKHFYEQGKADATKDIVAKSNNLDNKPRATSNGEVFINGLKVKAITGGDGSKLKFKKR
jgi:hypothetical protein